MNTWFSVKWRLIGVSVTLYTANVHNIAEGISFIWHDWTLGKYETMYIIFIIIYLFIKKYKDRESLYDNG